jgi:GntR family transcriptional regulator, transcriptional repressor for pyruvate dehydrogenase complex
VSVTTNAIDSIRAMVRSGELSPGERLPPEHELAERLGVSRGSLREAVRALSQINVLDVRRGDGTYVTSLAPSELLSGMVFAMELLQSQGLEEVLEVRRLLLPTAAALAAQRVTEGQLAEMHAVVDQLERATDIDEIARLHRRFQGLVGDATGNETLSSILRALQIRGENVRRAWLSSDPGLRDVALAHQRMLLAALEHGDSDMARSIATVQVDDRRRWIERLRTGAPAMPPLMGQPLTGADVTVAGCEPPRAADPRSDEELHFVVVESGEDRLGEPSG